MNNISEPYKKEFEPLISKIWKLVFVRAILLIALGLAIFAWPFATLRIITIILGIFFIADGLVDVIMSIFSMQAHPWLLNLIKGIAQIILGIIVIKYTGLTIGTMFFILGILFLISGLAQIFDFSGKHKRIGSSRTWEVISGILTLIVGFLLFMAPLRTGIALTWVIGFYAIISGIIILISALSIHRYIKKNL